MIDATDLALRQALLAVAVLEDVDLTPHGLGASLDGSPEVLVGWTELRRALGGSDPASAAGRLRLARWLRLRRRLGDLGPAGVTDRLRAYGCPVHSGAHPGLDWVRSRILGDALDLGLGLLGLDATRPDTVLPLPEQALVAAGVSGDDAWPAALDRLAAAGEAAATLRGERPDRPLRPVADHDVVTLLGSAALRRSLLGTVGMASVAVPVRTRGWTDLRHADPAFAVAAAALTDEAERGFDRPLLVTAEEVVMVPAGGRPERIVLRDPAPLPEWLRERR